MNPAQTTKIKTLILIPTQFELGRLRLSWGPEHPKLEDVVIEICGFGAIVAASRTAQLVALYRPASVMLLGIAGAYSSRTRIGSAYSFSRIACDGIGIGSGETFESASQHGWQQWPGDISSDPIEGEIHLGKDSDDYHLVTVCGASMNAHEAQLKISRHPNADAEDMEAFGVAASCHLTQTQLTVVRGISNQAGDRDKANWQVDQALDAAWQLVLKSLPSNRNG